MKKLLIALFAFASLSTFAQNGFTKRAANKEFAGCHVLLGVDGYKQLYVDGVFKGNFVNRLEDQELEIQIINLILMGSCREKLYTANSSIVLKAAAQGYDGCSVRLNVEGYNQVYIDETFIKNYINILENKELERKIETLIRSGDCREHELGNLELIDQVMADEFAGCSIKVETKELYLQLFVEGSFSGNYVIGKDNHKLAIRIAKLISQGKCRYKT